MVTDYLESPLTGDDRSLFADHVGECLGCDNYVGEMHVAIALMSELPAEKLSGDLESSLLARYREWVASVAV